MCLNKHLKISLCKSVSKFSRLFHLESNSYAPRLFSIREWFNKKKKYLLNNLYFLSFEDNKYNYNGSGVNEITINEPWLVSSCQFTRDKPKLPSVIDNQEFSGNQTRTV